MSFKMVRKLVSCVRVEEKMGRANAGPIRDDGGRMRDDGGTMAVRFGVAPGRFLGSFARLHAAKQNPE